MNPSRPRAFYDAEELARNEDMNSRRGLLRAWAALSGLWMAFWLVAGIDAGDALVTAIGDLRRSLDEAAAASPVSPMIVAIVVSSTEPSCRIASTRSPTLDPDTSRKS